MSLAILDIFGFEVHMGVTGNTILCLDENGNLAFHYVLFQDFQRNGFEQLCINYANESLQYFFNQSIFSLEQVNHVVKGVAKGKTGH